MRAHAHTNSKPITYNVTPPQKIVITPKISPSHKSHHKPKGRFFWFASAKRQTKRTVPLVCSG